MAGNSGNAPPKMPPSAGAMEQLLASLGQGPQRGLPPVERWDPAFCGEIDMRIAADGTWFYLGTPIGRPALVKLFASVLKQEGGSYFLVTPVEKVGIRVDDLPLQAVEMAVEDEGTGRQILFRTVSDDMVTIGPEHGLRFDRDGRDGLRPAVHVRRDLWARVTRALSYDLLAMGELREVDGVMMFGVSAGGLFFPAVPAAEIEGLV
jgi:uncharacterized protein